MYEKRIGIEVVKLLTAEELYGIFNQSEDDSFMLDLKAAREERAEELLRKHWMVAKYDDEQ
ncbi:hypothetical protein [Alicyclobacillus shizuokensis]|uniref:hypothetical protein n=1 Tax=Alicyclobacillus shizuokensis TaxID=392014 RepID=UPI000836AB94|nr:hypothetical protein [Alicyclobacillus shizuokensis]